MWYEPRGRRMEPHARGVRTLGCTLVKHLRTTQFVCQRNCFAKALAIAKSVSRITKAFRGSSELIRVLKWHRDAMVAPYKRFIATQTFAKSFRGTFRENRFLFRKG